MKKILFGLVAMSMMTYAAAPTLTEPATENTNIFQTGQSGQIVVNGNLSSKVPQIKYVVYSSMDGTYNANDGEIWKLPSFTIGAYTSAPSDLNTYGFAGQPLPKIYVKRVNGSNNDVIELAGEKVSFKLQLDSSWNGTITGKGAELVNDFQSTGEIWVTPFSFLSKTELESMLNKAGTANKTITSYDPSSYPAMIYLFENNANKGYGGGALFKMVANSNIFSIETNTSTFAVSSNYLTDAQKVDKYFATTRPISSEVAVLVKVQ